MAGEAIRRTVLRFRSMLARACLAVPATLAAAGCAGTSPAASPSVPATSSTVVQGTAASCAGLNRSQQLAAAKIVFDAVMLPGATAPNTHGVLASPARARVEHYLKGSGPAVVTVQTAIETLPSGATRITEDGIRPRPGEHWQINTSSTTEPYATSICLGSRRLPGRSAHFSGGGISFDYPAAWHARTFTMPPAPFSSWIVWLSPQPMHSPCITHRGTHNTSITCTDPVSRLDRDSILAYWTTNTEPIGFHPGPGTPITIDGRRGIWRVQTDTTQAPNLGETELITVIVPTPGSRDSWYQLTALLRGPDVIGLTAQVKMMLRTVRWLRQ
jgi:hypothetical protein